MEHYRCFTEKLFGCAIQVSPDKATRARMICLLVPYLEGCLITAPSLPSDADTVADMIAEPALSLADRQMDDR
ncbi:hypothetical protein ACFORG_03360 [Lutimaribacter marinistellae]|uniref:Uncharacterized protein n=1 Tax=Lutimaribacter marinistellae TaxID=1820329 RepID=A0ABV7TFA9_9RHOB